MAYKRPIECPPTHEYRFTRSMTMQYNSEHHVVRIFYKGQIVQDWLAPSVSIDLNKFIKLPYQQAYSAQFNDHYTKLRNDGSIPKFMGKWINKLPADDYLELLEDIRALVLFAEIDLMTEIKTQASTADVTLVHIVQTY